MDKDLRNTEDAEQSQTVTTEDTKNSEVVGVSLWMAILMSFLAAIMSIAFYHFVIAPKPPKKLAVIDVQAISSTLENDARKSLVENLEATDADREAAAKAFEAKMKTLQSIVTQVGAECDCTLLIKAALLNNSSNKSNGIVDYTSEVREKLGLTDSAKMEEDK